MRDLKLGEFLKEEGMSNAVNNADKICFKWSDQAYSHLLNYTNINLSLIHI